MVFQKFLYYIFSKRNEPILNPKIFTAYSADREKKLRTLSINNTDLFSKKTLSMTGSLKNIGNRETSNRTSAISMQKTVIC